MQLVRIWLFGPLVDRIHVVTVTANERSPQWRYCARFEGFEDPWHNKATHHSQHSMLLIGDTLNHEWPNARHL